MSQQDVALYDRFATEARRYGVSLTAASPGEVVDANRPPAIGTPLPWDDVELPDAVETNPTSGDVECCGMAGSFGYKEQYYELAMDVGSNLETQLRDADPDHVIASGTSCTDQIGDLLGEEPAHVIELVASGEENS